MQQLEAEGGAGIPEWERLLGEAPVGVLCFGAEGEVLRISPSLEQWLGMDAEHWLGRPFAELAGHPRLGRCVEPLLYGREEASLVDCIDDRWLRLTGQEVR
ncbi:PAS domain-containing protein [Thiohalorhabdus sp.]|uniref:PAS domain-containing protein n=1 Tax=Thiohalorhabdus sp. TaxID=3094134 RepID=UPI002FC2BD17